MKNKIDRTWSKTKQKTKNKRLGTKYKTKIDRTWNKNQKQKQIRLGTKTKTKNKK